MQSTIKIVNDVRHQCCPLCGGHDIKFKSYLNYRSPTSFSTNSVELNNSPELWKCLSCNSGFVQNIISEHDSKLLYESGDSSSRWSFLPFKSNKPKSVVRKIEEILYPGLRVIDIGCADGAFLDFAKERGCITSGIEYSSSNLSTIEKKGHIAHTAMDLINEEFDVITAFDVVEHLYDIDKFLHTCMKKLSTNGRLLIVTGDISSFSARLASGKWWYANYPEHIIFPSLDYLKSHPDVNRIDSFEVYSNSKHEKINLFMLSPIINFIRLLMGRFSASPAIGNDHMLVILYPK
jgi:SAM-dependent methyltransferase